VTRQARDTEELNTAAEKLGLDRRAFNHLHLVVADTGPQDGAATYTIGDLPRLGAVDAPDLKTTYELALAAARAALKAGAPSGDFEIHNHQLLRQLQRDFTVVATPISWEPRTESDIERGAPAVATHWRIEVDLQDAIRQLENHFAR
jgi:hypothetical protein